jgi:hypothetical protein
MIELRQVIRDLKKHIPGGPLSGRELVDSVIAGLEAIDSRLVEIERKLPADTTFSLKSDSPSAKNAVTSSNS